MSFIVAKKLNMSQHFLETGEVVPVTILKAMPMVVTLVKTKAGKDGYDAVQLGIASKLTGKRKLNKAETGHLKDRKGFTKTVEFRVSDPSKFEVGQIVDIDTFEIGELVNCVGVAKGRGFAGAMKRHGFAGFPASHGHDKPRSVGSIGQRFPQHVRKGLRMAGHMGTLKVTVKNLQIVEVDKANHLLAVKGAVPIHRNGLVNISSTGKTKPVGKPVKVEEGKKKK